MSRHHTLPPIISTPPEPTKIKSARRKSGAGGVWTTRETDEAEESGDSQRPGSASRTSRSLGTPIEATERRNSSGSGKLSSDTLRAMLALQEVDDGDTAGVAAPKTD
ncbi:MAG: hypothetical protein ABW213_05350 [Tardiphaga sp.]